MKCYISNRESVDNLEFRKVKSLNFLYEVSEDGRFLRNVKSKKYLKVFKDVDNKDRAYWKVQIRRNGETHKKMMHNLVAECWLGDNPNKDIYTVDHLDRNKDNNHYSNLRYATRSEQMKNRNMDYSKLPQSFGYHPVRIKNCQTGEVLDFESKKSASRYISEQTGISPRTIDWYFTKKRKHSHGFDIIYLAQTRHVDSKE